MAEESRRGDCVKLIAKLAEVAAEVDCVPKRGKNTFHNYDYATEADIQAAVRKGLSGRGVMILPSAEELSWRDVKTKSGTHTIATLHVKFTLTDGLGEVDLWAYGEGQDVGDKATYKAMTGALKYLLLKLFLIPTGNDPEADSVIDRTPHGSRESSRTNEKAQPKSDPKPRQESKPEAQPEESGDDRKTLIQKIREGAEKIATIDKESADAEEAIQRASAFRGKKHVLAGEEMTNDERWYGGTDSPPFETREVISFRDPAKTRNNRWLGLTLGRIEKHLLAAEGAKEDIEAIFGKDHDPEDAPVKSDSNDDGGLL